MRQLRRFWNQWNKPLVVIAAAVWTVITVVTSGMWSVYQVNLSARQFETRLEHEKKQFEDRIAQEKKQFQERLEYDVATRRIESQKPFLEKRLQMYSDFIKVAGSLTEIDLEVTDERWKDNVKRFWQMRWGELEMLGDSGIRNAARLVGEQIDHTSNNTDLIQDRHPLRWAVECLADELRYSIEHTWGLDTDARRKSILGQLVTKLPDGCTQNRRPPLRPAGMP